MREFAHSLREKSSRMSNNLVSEPDHLGIDAAGRGDGGGRRLEVRGRRCPRGSHGGGGGVGWDQVRAEAAQALVVT